MAAFGCTISQARRTWDMTRLKTTIRPRKENP
jgi:hypothetical protein